MTFDLAIIGAGPAGLSMARALAGSGLRIALIEQQGAAALADPPFDGREIALSLRTLSTLRASGVFDHVPADQVFPLEHAVVLNGNDPRPMRVSPLRGKQAPTALFCSNDLLATAVIADLVGLGLSVPADISVCGFDGMRFGALLTPPLTTVAQPSDGIGQAACSNLLAQIHGQPAQSNRLPHCIVVGGTAAAVRR